MSANTTEAQADYFADAPGYMTHEVLNQAGALAEYNAYSADKPLVEAMKVFGADWADGVLRRAGRAAPAARPGRLGPARARAPV